MGEYHTRSSTNSHTHLKGASIKDVCKAYKSLIMRWHPDKTSKTHEDEAKLKSINGAYFEALNKKQEDANVYGGQDSRDNNGGGGDHLYNKPRSVDDQLYTPSFVSRAASRRCQTPSPSSSPISRSMSRRNSSTTPNSPNEIQISRSKSRGTGTNEPPLLRSKSRGTSTIPSSSNEPPLSRSKSSGTGAIPNSRSEPLFRSGSRRSTTPIMFSSSNTRTKPPPVEKQLGCTLEELLNGCTKKIKVTRDVITNTGMIVQEEEILRIKVKPGWKKGTKVTFEGMGDEKPGFLAADIIFLIAERRHPIFKRDDNDLILSVELPLVKALTGCTLSIPLLGGEKMGISLDEIVYPGYEKIIPGQGMPNTKENGKRGNLRVKFRIIFPKQLTDEQRSDVVDILQDCS